MFWEIVVPGDGHARACGVEDPATLAGTPITTVGTTAAGSRLPVHAGEAGAPEAAPPEPPFPPPPPMASLFAIVQLMRLSDPASFKIAPPSASVPGKTAQAVAANRTFDGSDALALVAGKPKSFIIRKSH